MGSKTVLVHEIDGGVAAALLDENQIGAVEPDFIKGVYNWRVSGRVEGSGSTGFVRMAEIGSDEDNRRATQAYQKMLEGVRSFYPTPLYEIKILKYWA